METWETWGRIGATYTYDAKDNRVRKDVTGSPSTEYIYFGGNVVSERNVTTGAWSDYIFANGKRIAKADNFDHSIHLSGQICGNCGWQWYFWGFTDIGPLSGRVVQSGDSLRWRQWNNSGSQGGIILFFTDGTATYMNGLDLLDQNGEEILRGTQATNHWEYRAANMTPAVGKAVSAVYLYADGMTTPGQFDMYVQDLVYTGADGTIQPLFSENPTLPGLSSSGSSGMTPGRLRDQPRPNATSYSWWASTMYYHGDQIGSSRLMTSDGGWPVWQGTFLPYGEEYNQQITTNHYKFTGKERDSESGLDYFGARYYGSGLGRFVTPDWAAKATAVPYAEFADPQSLNLYTYVRNIPTVRFDADGHDAWSTFKASVEIIGSGVGAVLKEYVKESQDNLNNVANAFNDFVQANYRYNTGLCGCSAPASQWQESENSNAKNVNNSNSQNTNAQSGQKTFQTYQKSNSKTGKVYSGKTSGTKTAEQNVAARDANHHMNEKGFGEAQLDKSSTSADAIRGREQQLIQESGSAQSQGGTSGNAINGVSPTNPKADIYKNAAEQEFGKPK